MSLVLVSVEWQFSNDILDKSRTAEINVVIMNSFSVKNSIYSGNNVAISGLLAIVFTYDDLLEWMHSIDPLLEIIAVFILSVLSPVSAHHLDWLCLGLLTHTRPRDMARSRPPFWIFSFAAWKWVNMDGNWRNFDGNISSYV